MRILLDADFVIRLWREGAGGLLKDIARVHPLAMAVDVFDEIERGSDSWIPTFQSCWDELESTGLAGSLEWLVGSEVQLIFLKLSAIYAPKVADLTTPFDNRGDLVNIAWLTVHHDLVYVTEDHGARYHAFLETPGLPSQIATPWALFRSTYSCSPISADSLRRLLHWNKEKKGPKQRPCWWEDWLFSLSPAP